MKKIILEKRSSKIGQRSTLWYSSVDIIASDAINGGQKWTVWVTNYQPAADVNSIVTHTNKWAHECNIILVEELSKTNQIKSLPIAARDADWPKVMAPEKMKKNLFWKKIRWNIHNLMNAWMPLFNFVNK